MVGGTLKRLVSAFYRESYPFHNLSFVDDVVASVQAEDLTKDDILVVWGGADISPALYNKRVSPRGYGGEYPSQRDAIEWALMRRARELGIPIIGVCRGAQMLCALAGGYLIQHIENHGGSHEVETYDGKKFSTNSIHHQMMVAPPNVSHEVLAQIPKDKLLSSVYWDEEKKVDHNQEPEFIYFNDIKGFAIQWHPEMMPENCAATQFVLNEVEKRVAQ